MHLSIGNSIFVGTISLINFKYTVRSRVKDATNFSWMIVY